MQMRGRPPSFELSAVANYTSLFCNSHHLHEHISPQLRLHEVVPSEKFNHDLSTLDRLFELKQCFESDKKS